jgi:hypothetical protein
MAYGQGVQELLSHTTWRSLNDVDVKLEASDIVTYRDYGWLLAWLTQLRHRQSVVSGWAQLRRREPTCVVACNISNQVVIVLV